MVSNSLALNELNTCTEMIFNTCNRASYSLTVLITLISGLLILFTGCKKEDEVEGLKVPSVRTSDFQSINFNSVELGGIVLNSNGSTVTERGICWDTIPNPNVSNHKASAEGSLGEFMTLIDSLTQGKPYYFRAYACNEIGVGYGDVRTAIPGYYTYGEDVYDNNGNTYATVIIGNQHWMAENLKSTSFCNGDPIPFVENMTDWVEAGSYGSSFSVFAFIDFNESQGAIFGNIYNHSVPRDARNICPCGWRIPSWHDWIELLEFVDPNTTYSLPGYPTSTSASQKLRSVEFWSNQFGSTAGTNEAGLNILPGGILGTGGIATLSKYWSTTQHPGDSLLIIAPQFNSYSENIAFSINWLTSGAYIRCIRN